MSGIDFNSIDDMTMAAYYGTIETTIRVEREKNKQPEAPTDDDSLPVPSPKPKKK